MFRYGTSLFQWTLVIVLFYFQRLLETSFGSLIFFAFLGFIYVLPLTNKICEMKKYLKGEFSDCALDSYNPIFVRGFFRKRIDGRFWADIKGHFFCQTILLPTVLVTWLYIFLVYYGYVHKNLILERILQLFLGAIIAIRLILDAYYYRCYIKDYQYVESEDGIWKPFSFLAKNHGLKKYNPFRCQYEVKFEELINKIKNNSIKQGYTYDVSYNDEQNKKMYFFSRIKGNKLDILEILHVREYRDMEIEKYNTVFEEYWKNHIRKNMKDYSVKVTFLICIDQWTAEFGKRFERSVSVNQKKERYRLPAFLVQEEYSKLLILCNNNKRYGKKEYNKMRKELLSILDISERYNYGKYSETMIEDFLNED